MSATIVLRSVFGFIWFLGWMAGIVIAQGFWSTLFAIFTGGFWAWYLVIEKLLIHFHIV